MHPEYQRAIADAVERVKATTIVTNEAPAHLIHAVADRVADLGKPTNASPSLDVLVDRFLTWPVPASVYPDGIPGRPGRTGTNLLSAIEAREMLRHVLGLT